MPKDFTSQTILAPKGISPANLTCAEALVATLGPDDPFYLPISQDARIWADFSRLPIMLSALADGAKPPLAPIDTSPLAQLCQEHKDDIGEQETWTYPFFYLELLAEEKRMRPLFWGARTVAIQLRTHEAYQRSNGNDSPRRRYCQELWNAQADKWIEAGLIEPDDDRPWLSRLSYSRPDARWGAPAEDRFSSGLQFDKLPFYDTRTARTTMISAMKIDLWRSSIFCPAPMSRHEHHEWKRACKRFALDYRRRTLASARKAQFEAFVRSRRRQGMANKAIAREAVMMEVYPFGTRKRQPYAPDDLANCRRAICRLVAQRERFWQRQDEEI